MPSESIASAVGDPIPPSAGLELLSGPEIVPFSSRKKAEETLLPDMEPLDASTRTRHTPPLHSTTVEFGSQWPLPLPRCPFVRGMS